ncbi:MAG: phosphoglycerate dehydrogenase [Pseudomonadota bacterium]
MYKVLTLNNIALAGLRKMPRASYEVSTECSAPDAILLRSYKMHDMDIADSIEVIGRAGAGVNNIPVDAMSERGVPVLNAPGANANAVKELVIAGMLMAARNIPSALDFAAGLEGDDAAVSKQVEAGKKQFVGTELPGKTLGVIGLGAIGVQVANAASGLGMKVIGFDPKMTVERAWELSSGVFKASGIDQLCRESDFISVHVPLMDATRNMVSAERIASLPKHGIVVNLARGGIVDEDAIVDALDAGSLAGYVADFPTGRLIRHPKVIALPHLGASTLEAEENCAVRVVDNVRDFLENGNIKNSVNFPDVFMPRIDTWRIGISNRNVPNMVGQISTVLADAKLNIADLLNKSRDNVAYSLIDLDGEPTQNTIDQLAAIEGVLRVRSLGRPGDENGPR